MTGFRDGRLPPFAWVSRAASVVLLDEFKGRERVIALSVYLSLSLLSSEQRRGNHDGIVATRREVYETAGVSERTLDPCVARLVKINLLVVTRRREGKLNLPNEWTLVEPVQGGASDAPPPPVQAVPQGGARENTPLEEEHQEEEATANAAASLSEAEKHPDALCLSTLLADLIRTNDPKAKPRPESDRWVRDMRLLLADRDGDVNEVEFVLRYSQRDEFWRSVVLSPANLRKHFTALSLKAWAKRKTDQDPLAGLSQEARARAERNARRMGVTVEEFMQQIRTNPTGGNDDHNGNGEGSDRGAQRALARGA